MKNSIITLVFALFTVLFATAAFAATDVTCDNGPTPKTSFEAYLLYGHGVRMDNDGKNSNDFVSGKIKYRPWEVGPADYRVGLGAFLLGEFGSGKAGKNVQNDYDWSKYGGGLNAKLFSSKYWDWSVDGGVAQMTSKTVGAKQTDMAIVVSSNFHVEQRRAVQSAKRVKYILFPEADVFVQTTMPIKSEKKSDAGASMVTDEKGSKDLKVTVGIVDIPVYPKHVLVPGISAGVGTSGVGTEDRTNVNAGLQIKWRYDKKDVLTVKVEDKNTFGKGAEKDRNDITATVNLSWSF